jgi:RHS repeat-associated protein
MTTRGQPFPIVFLLSAALATASAARAKTTVHTYSYNVDGALTAVITQVDDQASTTTYLTWDDFTPDAATPTTGTVSTGDGRLVGFGPSPGTDNLTARFMFDPRDRLLEYSGDAGDETYDYDAGGKMASSSAGGDGLRFYFDGATNSVVTNIHQDSTGLTSAYLGRNRFLSDGTEQILLRPRKDMACTYDAASQTLQSYAYDAFGAPPEKDKPSGTYDLRDNSFRYSGEYRDPIWGGYYLRARWYDPDLPVFLSRDPAQHLNHYAYGNGNPVMNEDPSGYGHGGLRGFLATLNRGVGGHFARIFLAPLIGPLQIAAYPKQFWQAVKTDKGGIDVFLALGVASEAVGGIADYALAGTVGLGVRFGARTFSDLGIGIGSSIGAGASRGFKHFDYNAFAQGLEYSLHPFLARGVTGLNVRAGFQFGASDVARLADQLEKAPEGTALVFRQKGNVPSVAVGDYKINLSPDPPLLQALHLGSYHERLIAFTKDEFFMNDVVKEGLRVEKLSLDGLDEVKAKLSTLKGKFQFVGKLEDLGTSRNTQKAFFGNPWNVEILKNRSYIREQELPTRDFKVRQYGRWTNNCQHHAYAVLQDLGLR